MRVNNLYSYLFVPEILFLEIVELFLIKLCVKWQLITMLLHMLDVKICPYGCLGWSTNVQTCSGLKIKNKFA